MKIFICPLIFLTMYIVSCEDQALPPDPYDIIKFDIIHRNSLRIDSLSMIPKTHYRGKVQHIGGELKRLDTTFIDHDFGSKFYKSFTDSVIWNTVGNLPDPNDSLPDFYTLSLQLRNGKKHTIEFSQKIPEIENLISCFEELYLKLLP